MASQLLFVVGIFGVLLAQVIAQVFNENSCDSLLPSGQTQGIEGSHVVGTTLQPPLIFLEGDTIRVFVVVTAGENIANIIVQARSEDSTPVGSFGTANTVPPGSFDLLSCTGSNEGTIFSNNLNTRVVQLSWTAPSIGVGNVRFVASYVDTNGLVFSPQESQLFTGPPAPDNTPPVLSCPTGPVDVNYAIPVCSDAEDPSPSVVCAPPPGSGISPVTCTCTDNRFLVDTCNFDVSVSPCDSGPCMNGGTCFDVPGGYFCFCPTGFPQPNCQPDLGPCTPNPCLNGGSCSEIGNTFSCSCLLGFQPPTCTPIGPCGSNPCMNGGTCNVVGGGNAFFCTCPPGLDQPRCAGPACDPNPCLGGATCTETPSAQTGYTCHIDIGIPCI